MSDVLSRIGKEGRSRSLTLELRPVHLAVALGGVLLVASSWAVGMKMGYRYAKVDAAYVLRTSNPEPDLALPPWRKWADSEVPYTPPEWEGMIFDSFSRSLPGGDGITTGDVYNGYQRRIERAFFERQGRSANGGTADQSVADEPAATASPVEGDAAPAPAPEYR